MELQINSALISVFNKTGLEPIVRKLNELNIKIYSTGGTQNFIEQLGINCTSVEDITHYPSILGGRVKTLHPKVFGGILARRNNSSDKSQLLEYEIPLFDLVIVDLYPFEETVRNTDNETEIIEKIDIGGVSLIRAAAKNHQDVCVVASTKQYNQLLELLESKKGFTTIENRKKFASYAFTECAHYDVAIAEYFNKTEETDSFQISIGNKQTLRYGENPHQSGSFYGDISELFNKISGKELSFNNLADIDAACKLMKDFSIPVFAIIKHTNVCGIACKDTVEEAWTAALSCDPESAFGGVLITNQTINLGVAEKINDLFFEILISPSFDADALELLKNKKNRILLQQKKALTNTKEYKSILNGVLVQDTDNCNYLEWKEAGARCSEELEREDLLFANTVCKHLKSNAIAIVKNKQLIGKGCGQTSRIDALRHAIDKAQKNGFSLQNAVMASDAFFPFSDCVEIAHEAGIVAVIQPGGSVRDNDSIKFCREKNMVMILTQTRHFKH